MKTRIIASICLCLFLLAASFLSPQLLTSVKAQANSAQDSIRRSGNFNFRSPFGAAQQQATAVDPILPVQTTTPNADGSITHVVKYGENLIDIATAYGLTLTDLYAMNRSLDPKKPVYYEGQVLIIRAAFTETPYVTATLTPPPPTNTPRPTRTPRPTYTATPVRSPVPTRTLTSTPAFRIPTLKDLGNRRPIIAYALIIISSIGLIVLVVTWFLSGRRRK